MAIPGYQILRKIQQGGMSTVYLAVQKSIQREVALKVMSPALNSDSDFGRRFHHEARITGHLSHPNIITIHDVGSHNQYNYITMDYLAGDTLKVKIKEGFSPQKALQVIREIASALDYSHRKGFIHRDIKPDNILFRTDGSSVLCDFGIAKALKSTVKKTNIGKVLGTPYYMSPEQTRGKEVDGRTDIYSLGSVAYEMLTGQPPYSGNDPVAVAVKHMTADIPELSGDLKIYQPLINKMMAKKPDERFQSGKEIIGAIDDIENHNSSKISHDLSSTAFADTNFFSITGVLLKVLVSTVIISIKNTLSSKTRFAKSSMQLDEKHLAAIDHYILENVDEKENNEKESAITHITPPKSSRWVYWPISLIALILGSFIYLDTIKPDQVRQIYNLVAHNKNLEKSTHNDNHYFVTASDTFSSEKGKTLELPGAPGYIPNEPLQFENPPSLNGSKQQQEPRVTEEKYSINITTIPSSATIRIINIKPKYSPELKLGNGAYHLEVSADNYVTKKLWVKIADKNIRRNITLEEMRSSFVAGTNIIDHLSGGGMGPGMVVLPQETVTVAKENGDIDHQLSLSSPVAVSSYEVSFDQYDTFAKSTQRPLPRDYSWGRTHRPVIGITQQDAKAYAAWISEQTGYTYRLLTKAEWEYAARSGVNSPHWWGIEPGKKKANCRSGCKSRWSKLFSSSTAPVGNYPANLYGLYDTAGNVAEWLSDCNIKNRSTNSKQNESAKSSNCKHALIAGGSHQDNAKAIRNSAFQSRKAMTVSKTIGFRILLEL